MIMWCFQFTSCCRSWTLYLLNSIQHKVTLGSGSGLCVWTQWVLVVSMHHLCGPMYTSPCERSIRQETPHSRWQTHKSLTSPWRQWNRKQQCILMQCLFTFHWCYKGMSQVLITLITLTVPNFRARPRSLITEPAAVNPQRKKLLLVRKGTNFNSPPAVE